MNYVMAVLMLAVCGIVGAWHVEQAEKQGLEPRGPLTEYRLMRKRSRASNEARRQTRERRQQSSRPVAYSPSSGRSDSVPATDRSPRQTGNHFTVLDWSGSVPSRPDMSDYDRDVIMSAADDVELPQAILFDILTNESGGLERGWGTGASWHLPSELQRPGGACMREYSPSSCRRWHRALEVICEQRRHDGTRVCDMNRVRVSKTYDMGRMQHNTSTIVRPKNGRAGRRGHCFTRTNGEEWCWGEHIRDIDGDGVYDPHDPIESVIAAALLLRLHYERHGLEGRQGWVQAVWRYGGIQPRRGESEKTRRRRENRTKKTYRNWARWCSIDGYC